jgi:hypothetical protein
VSDEYAGALHVEVARRVQAEKRVRELEAALFRAVAEWETGDLDAFERGSNAHAIARAALEKAGT